jgi:hypothetical protein
MTIHGDIGTFGAEPGYPALGVDGFVLRTSLLQMQGYLHPSEQRAFAGNPASPFRITMKP